MTKLSAGKRIFLPYRVTFGKWTDGVEKIGGLRYNNKGPFM